MYLSASAAVMECCRMLSDSEMIVVAVACLLLLLAACSDYNKTTGHSKQTRLAVCFVCCLFAECLLNVGSVGYTIPRHCMLDAACSLFAVNI